MRFDSDGYYIPYVPGLHERTGTETRPEGQTLPDDAPRRHMPDIWTDPTGTAYQPVDWRTRWDTDTTQEWLIEPLIPVGGQVALYSDPKVGKSLLMLELAAGLATGKPLFGHQQKEPIVVLYVDHENRLEHDVINRLKAMGYEADMLDNLKLVSMPQVASLDTEQGGQSLVAAAIALGARLVVIDTVSRTIKGEENSNDTWLQFYRSTGQGLKAAGIALVRLDHTGKDSDKGQRGGSAKSGDVDMVWKLIKTTDEIYELKCEAHRMEITEDRLAFKREQDPLRSQILGNAPAAVREAREAAWMGHLTQLGADKGVTVREARDLLRDAGLQQRNGAITKELLDKWRLTQ